MKTKHTIVAFVAMFLLVSCEPEEVLVDTFTPNTPDTTYVSGMDMRLTLNGSSVNYYSAGYGFSCLDSTGLTEWAFITGNGVTFNPVTNEFTTGPNDTTLVLVFGSQNFTIGTYTVPGFPESFCILDGPDNSNLAFKQYDPAQLQVIIARITTDSIFGSYSGALREIIDFTVDSLGNLIPIYSNQIDSVSTQFGVKRDPC